MKSVLIISTKEDEVRLIRESLPSDYQAENTDSVKDALNLHRQCSFDVIFSDLKLLQATSETDDVAEAIRLFKEMNPLAEARRHVTEDFERQYHKELFARSKGRVNRAAEDAGISSRQLNKLMVKYGIQKESFKD
jgi:DNA-binding NtrC family response regulator